MLLSDIVATSKQVANTRSRRGKVSLLAACLRGLTPAEIGTAVSFLSGLLPQGRIGIGAAILRRATPTFGSKQSMLKLVAVSEQLDRIVQATGPGSNAERIALLRDLLTRATREEQEFLVRLLLGELRQGALEGVMTEAVAEAFSVPVAEVRRAVMRAGEVPKVASATLSGGLAALRQFSVTVLEPLRPMLAQSAENVADALSRLGAAAFEFKMDGVRVQVHKAGDDIRVFTRRLNDVTRVVPDVVEVVRQLPVTRIILDGEVLALNADGSPRPFQTTMRRFGRTLNVEQMRHTLPLRPFFFDCLVLAQDELIDRPAQQRFEALAATLPPAIVMPRLVTADRDRAEGFLRRALHQGHEGVMAKATDAAYQAGNRGSCWLKVKAAHTLELVVLAAEWGHGRRSGWLSNLHLGAFDPITRGFVMLGKTFKGMTDEVLAWQTLQLQQLEVARDAHTVYVKPELVVEVTFNDIQASRRYPAGLALRFARLKRYRPDKKAEQADTLETVRLLYSHQVGTPQVTGHAP